MTGAERQARHRAAHAAGKPVIHRRRPTDRRGRARRRIDARDELVAAQAEYTDWLETLPDETSRAIVDLDLSDLLPIEPPRGFGRD